MSKWPQHMSGDPRICLVNTQFWPAVVCWPAFINFEALHCLFMFFFFSGLKNNKYTSGKSTYLNLGEATSGESTFGRNSLLPFGWLVVGGSTITSFEVLRDITIWCHLWNGKLLITYALSRFPNVWSSLLTTKCAAFGTLVSLDIVILRINFIITDLW